MQLIILLLGIAISILTFSGYAETLNFNENLMYYAWGIAAFFWLFKRKKFTFKIGKISYLLSVLCIILLINVLDDYRHYSQLLNFTTLFGVVVGTSILSLAKWNRLNFIKIGLIIWGISWCLLQLFLPGSILSNWNDNSAISLMPALLCGLGFIYLSDIRFKNYIFYGCIVFTISVILTLQNRSSILSLFVFGFLAYPFIFKFINKKKTFRILYISALLINIGMPLFNEFIGQLDIYNDLMSISQEYVNKAGGFSNRDVKWLIALEQLSENPLVGNGGVRTVYFHNFSCDVLTEFGWLGFAVFAAMYCAIMEKCFSNNGKSNIFLLAFVCLLILNTFENALFADDCFTIFPYILFAVAWQLKYSGSKPKPIEQ